MRRILYLTTVPGTLRAFLLPFAHHFRSRGVQVDAMAQGITACAECVEAFDRVWDVDWSRNPLYARNLLRAPRMVQEVVAQEGYDLVHVTTPIAAFVTRYALRRFHKRGRPKTIYSAQGFHFYRGGARLKNAAFVSLEKLAGRWTDYLVVVNREDERIAKRYRIVRPERVRCIPGLGVDTNLWSRTAVSEAAVEWVRRELGLTPNDRLFLMVGEFIPRKRHQDALRAFARLKRVDVHLAFAGSGPLVEEMKRLAYTLKVQDRVHFLGYRRDIPTLMCASVATLLPSEQEGLPVSVIESLCLEVPVIGTEIRGTHDLLQGECGLLVKVGDVEGFTRAMAFVLDRPEDARGMSQRWRRNRMAAHDVRRILAQYEGLYAEAMGGHLRAAEFRV